MLQLDEWALRHVKLALRHCKILGIQNYLKYLWLPKSIDNKLIYCQAVAGGGGQIHVRVCKKLKCLYLDRAKNLFVPRLPFKPSNNVAYAIPLVHYWSLCLIVLCPFYHSSQLVRFMVEAILLRMGVNFPLLVPDTGMTGSSTVSVNNGV